MYSRYRVDTIWRYREGHRQTAIMSRTVKAFNDESAERWGSEMVYRTFGKDNVEIVKVNYICID
jgi:hypothetical protein